MGFLTRIRDFFTNLNTRVKSAGVTAIGWGVVTVVLYILSFKVFSYIALGVFLTRNWDTIVRWINGDASDEG